MATGLSNIFITGLEGETISCQFPSGTFNENTISELKLVIQDKTGVKLDNHRLLFGGRQLETIKNDRELTFRDYNISDGSTIILVVRFVGGGRPGFLPLRFADITSEDSFREVKLSNSAPDWRIIGQGVNFEGTCENRFCQAENKIVSIQRGFHTLKIKSFYIMFPIVLLVLSHDARSTMYVHTCSNIPRKCNQSNISVYIIVFPFDSYPVS